MSEKLPVAAATLWFHLKALHHAGLLDVRREGRFLYYRPNFQHMNDLLGFLTDHCCELADNTCNNTECTPGAVEVTTSRRKRA